MRAPRLTETIVGLPSEAVDSAPAELTRDEALARMNEAEGTLRAIGAGEVDAFVVSDGGGRRVFSLSTADRPYRMFVENMRDGAATLSASGHILYANQRLADLLLCPRGRIVGSTLAMYIPGGMPAGLERMRADSLGATLELDLVNTNGETVPVLVGGSPLAVEGDRLVCLTFTDLTAHKDQRREIARLGRAQAERLADLQHAQAALTEQATHDALTGLPNRILLTDRINQALAQSQRSGMCVSVLFVDLDRFKHVNDTQGHASGDVVLQRVAAKLVGALRPMDTVARIGGDEFAVLAPEVASHLHAVDLSERLIQSLSGPGDEDRLGAGVTASIGIAVSIGGRGNAEALLHEADTAMYQAKSLGGGRVQVFDPALRLKVRERAGAEKMLRSALDDGRVVAHYQPIVDLATGQVAAFEALARIAKSDGSILAPAAFVAAAEDSGLIVPLGTHVLDLACAEARGWLPSEPGGLDPAVAVNLSARQFDSGDLTDVVRMALDRSGLPPSCLHLELTETSVIDLNPEVVKQLGLIRDLGVEVGLDDFGTGYASLTHLRRLPITFVKIDQTFVRGLGSDAEDDGIVAAVIALASNLGLRSIAEGVETEAQLARLRELGSDQAQGYLFAKPLPAGEVRARLPERPRQGP
jgi:diguanylate cyclase (GGDEF)-like protein